MFSVECVWKSFRVSVTKHGPVQTCSIGTQSPGPSPGPHTHMGSALAMTPSGPVQIFHLGTLP